jgi:hypothetical protein
MERYFVVFNKVNVTIEIYTININPKSEEKEKEKGLKDNTHI